MVMAEATMQGVTLFTKTRKRQHDVFELALTYDGIEIRRPNESPRHLSWDRVSEWEIEQRRGGVVLTLRGGGSVTPLVIPHWKVDELDGVLREVTSHAPPDVAHTPNAPNAAPRFASAPPSFSTPPTAPRLDDIVPEGFLLPANGTSTEPSAPEIAPLVWPRDAPLDDLPNLSWPGAMTQPSADEATVGEFVLPEGPIVSDPTLFSPAISSTLVDPAPVPAPSAAAEPAPLADPVVEPVVTEGPVVDVLALVDDVLAGPDVIAPPEVVAQPVTMPPVVVEPEVSAPPVPPIVIPPKEGSPEAPTPPSRSDRRAERSQRARPKVELPKVERPVARPKVERTKVERPKAARRFSWGLAATVVLLGVLALAVALVLAQSAGIIHLPFFGSPA
jgi:hypothetical protein